MITRWICLLFFGMRLIRRPWKGCRFWDVPFTIPWKGCKFQKWGFPKWGYRIWNFRFFNVLHMEEAQVAYVVVWSSGGGVGGDVNVRVERFPHGTEEAHVAFVVVWSSGGVGGDVNVRIEHFLYVTEEVAVADILHCLTRFLRISCVNLCWSWLDFL